jgi:hypothetical protein
MKRRIAMLLVAAAATLISARPARAWDEVGHKVVARIAWNYMTPVARERAIALLMAAPADAGLRGLLPEDGRPLADRQRDLFVNAAYWADQIRSRNHPGNRFAHAEWHYVNFFWQQDAPGGPAIDRPDKGVAGELIAQETRIVPMLADAARPDSSRGVDLAWLLHLVGDAHQPLHNSARITPQDPDGDRGGNLFLLAGIYPFNNLHAYWDALIGYAHPWRAADRDESDYIGGIAESIARHHPIGRSQLKLGAYEDWSKEGLRVAQRVAFPAWLERGRPAPARYKQHAWGRVESRVATAGYRLAETLNQALGR